MATEDANMVFTHEDPDITMGEGDDDADAQSSTSEPQVNPPPIRHDDVVIDTYADGTKVYGLHLYPDTSQPTSAYLIMSSASLDEVNSQMKMTADALIEKLNENKRRPSTTYTAYETGIDILKGNHVALRYEIVEGYMMNGAFVNGENWAAGVNAPELVAWEKDVMGKIPRMVTLKSMIASTTPTAKGLTAATKSKEKATKVTKRVAAASKRRAPARKQKGKVAAVSVLATSTPAKINAPDIYCVCHMPQDNRQLFSCESGEEDCPYNGWFHLACQSMTAVPEGDWWCPMCRQGQDSQDEDGEVAMADFEGVPFTLRQIAPEDS
jgi:hypothetical protein